MDYYELVRSAEGKAMWGVLFLALFSLLTIVIFFTREGKMTKILASQSR
jgi:hypothetical protein